MLELEISPEHGESFRVYHWQIEQDVYEDDGLMAHCFEFICPPTDLEEDDNATVTLRADGVVTDYETEVAVVSDFKHRDEQKIALTTELQAIPDDASLA